MKRYLIFALVVIIIGGMIAGISVLQIQVNTLKKDVHELETSLYGHGPIPSLGESSIKNQFDAFQDEIEDYRQFLEDLESQIDSLAGIVSQEQVDIGEITTIVHMIIQLEDIDMTDACLSCSE